jgi:O-antigen ligase
MPLLVAAVAVLIPLVIAPGLFFYFDVTPKVTILLAGASAAVFTMPHRKGPVPNLARWFLAALAAYAVSLVASTIGSVDWPLSLIGSNWRRFGLLTHVAALLFAVAALFTLAGRSTARLLLLRSVAAGGIAASIYGTLQYFGYDPFLPNASYTIGEGEWAIVRPPATLGHASYAATYFLFTAFIGVAIARVDASRVWRSIGAGAAVLACLAIVLSGTRAAILGLIAGSAVLVLCSGLQRIRRAAALVVIVSALFALFYQSPAGERLRARVRWSMEDSHGGARLLLWKDSLKMAVARPVLGWGPETFSREFPRFQSRELAKAYPDFYHESPHNIFLDALVSSGAFGLISLLGLCGIGVYGGLVAIRNGSAEAPALTAALTASIIAQQFTTFTATTAFFSYLTVAILISIPKESWPTTGTCRFRVAAVPALVFAAFAVRLSVADHHLVRAKRFLEANDLQRSANAFQHSSLWQRPGRASDLWFSRALAVSAREADLLMPGVQRLREGDAAAERATQSAEDLHNAYYNQAGYRALRNDFAGVERSLRGAIDRAPNWFKPHWTLAQSLQLAGRLEEAEREAELAFELSGGKYPEVAQTLEEIRQRVQR